MSRDEDALRAAVMADPLDDTPRAVYADWLEENGRANRAALIRASLPALGGRDDDATRRPTPEDWGVGVRPLLELMPGEWLVSWNWQYHGSYCWHLPGGPEAGYWRCDVTFRRGFADEVSLPWAAWETHAPALLRRHPLTRVRITDASPLGVSRATIGAEAGEYAAWLWVLPHEYDLHTPWCLPPTVFNRLSSGRYDPPGPGYGPARFYPSEEAAEDDLSATVLAAGREAVGLPPLRWGEVPA